VYRFGDQLGAWADAGLAALGLGVAGIAAAAAPLAAAWLALAVWLGRRNRRLVGGAEAAEADSPPAVPPSDLPLRPVPSTARSPAPGD
jgi:hypothetical protein